MGQDQDRHRSVADCARAIAEALNMGFGEVRIIVADSGLALVRSTHTLKPEDVEAIEVPPRTA